jgi:hypothetical protein
MAAAPRAVAGDPSDADVVCIGMTDGIVWLTEDGGESFRPVLQMPTPSTGVRAAEVNSLRVLHN